MKSENIITTIWLVWCIHWPSDCHIAASSCVPWNLASILAQLAIDNRSFWMMSLLAYSMDLLVFWMALINASFLSFPSFFLLLIHRLDLATDSYNPRPDSTRDVRASNWNSFQRIRFYWQCCKRADSHLFLSLSLSLSFYLSLHPCRAKAMATFQPFPSARLNATIRAEWRSSSALHSSILSEGAPERLISENRDAGGWNGTRENPSLFGHLFRWSDSSNWSL